MNEVTIERQSRANLSEKKHKLELKLMQIHMLKALKYRDSLENKRTD
jgi:hypothetical protein